MYWAWLTRHCRGLGPTNLPRLGGGSLASPAEQVVHAHNAGNEQVGEVVASALVEAVALGESTLATAWCGALVLICAALLSDSCSFMT